MTATADHISQLRRMINEPTQSPYSDAILTVYIERYPVMDTAGLESGEEGWVVAYDLNAAASDLWVEKASAVQTYYNFSADGGRYDQNQLFETAMEQSRYYAARRKPASRYAHKDPKELSTSEETVSGLTWDETYAWWRVN